MRIENRRSKLETVVSKEEWQQMKDQGVSSLFRIIDKDETIKSQIRIPKEITEFKINRIEKIVTPETPVDIPIEKKKKNQ